MSNRKISIVEVGEQVNGEVWGKREEWALKENFMHVSFCQMNLTTMYSYNALIKKKNAWNCFSKQGTFSKYLNIIQILFQVELYITFDFESQNHERHT